MTKPAALLYCQHSLGLGHLVRSLALAQAVSRHFDLVFFNGGPVPQSIPLPRHIRFEHLPPLRMNADGTLAGCGDTAAIFDQRRARMLAIAEETKPRLLIVELYPFGRKKFATELDPLIASVRAGGGKVVCSVRDILVDQRADQARHDERAASCLNAAFDAVLVHADPAFVKIEDSFKPATPLAIPVHHTGFVANTPPSDPFDPDGPTLVTAGGGIVGQTLYLAAIEAQKLLWRHKKWPMTIVAGPFLPETDWRELSLAARDVGGLTLVRSVPGMAPLLARAGRVVSQCGYNSALEIVGHGRPVLFVPFARGQESEQTARARQLSAAGLAQWLPEQGLTGVALANCLLEIGPPAKAAALKFDGAQCSASLLRELAR